MEPSPAKGKPQGRLLVSTTLDAKDELEERLERCVGIVTSLINGLSEREANDTLTAHVCKGSQQHEEVCLGLFTLLLTEPAQAQRCYRDLTLVNRDGMNVVLIKINQILMEKFLKLQDVCRTQLVWLVRELVKSGWVLKSGMLIAMSVYTYLRLIVDHHGTPPLQALRQKEVDFCIGMLREKFMDCCIIGRDLLLTSRTSRKFLACRLTPDMETKLLFMTSRKRYQDWFQRQYLSTADSQSLRCDLIRYICGVVHPSNEVLSSDILPRWAIIGWLLTTCTSNVAASNAKLALFYDWLFFNPEKDSIMNIEPAILVMHHSMKPHPAITATLLDFMCRIIPNFFPPLEAQVRQGVFNSLNFIMEKRVLAHLAPLFDNPKLDRELRSMLRDRFPEFCSSPSPPVEVKMEESAAMEMDNHVMDKEDSCYDNTEAAFSDDEEELNNKGKKREFRFHPIKEAIIEEPVDITPYVDQLDETVKEKVLQLQKGNDTEAQCEVMQEIVDLILEEDFDSEQMSSLASCLAELFKGHFRGDVLPDEITEESLEESVCKPVCLVFRNLCQMQEDNSGFSVLLDMLAELYQKQPKIGYHLLYYLKASKAAMGKMSLYESFAQATALGDLHTCLMMDMKACQEDDIRLLCYLTPSIYSQHSSGDHYPHPAAPQIQGILRHWAAKHDDPLGEHIKALLIKNNNLPRKRQSLRSSSSKLAQLTLEQILEHMDNLRLNLSNTKHNFFTQTPILQALQHVQASCDEAHKMRFSDLFSLAEEYEDSSSKPPKSRRKAPASSPRSRKGAAPPASNEEESASSSASEEEDSKPKAPKRKRKGSSAVGSDSD
ncbi:hypothetical protein JZ751_000125 [Albula glossodonta]|uniref:Integrator complex subunit 3 n=1 Tax=Albula glossodonta TaxID=121402 RepID=A0A8T2PV00_9TELE|nr:hypothetical protein JZ751_000125 [Albula glossodonta]